MWKSEKGRKREGGEKRRRAAWTNVRKRRETRGKYNLKEVRKDHELDEEARKDRSSLRRKD